MTKILSILFTALVVSAAWAFSVQPGDHIFITTPSGEMIVGVGSVDDDQIDIELLEDFTGFARFSIRSSDGVTITRDVYIEDEMIEAFAGSGTPEEGDLRAIFATAGFDLEIDSEDFEDIAETVADLERERDDRDDRDEGDDRDDVEDRDDVDSDDDDSDDGDDDDNEEDDTDDDDNDDDDDSDD